MIKKMCYTALITIGLLSGCYNLDPVVEKDTSILQNIKDINIIEDIEDSREELFPEFLPYFVRDYSENRVILIDLLSNSVINDFNISIGQSIISTQVLANNHYGILVMDGLEIRESGATVFSSDMDVTLTLFILDEAFDVVQSSEIMYPKFPR